MSAPTQVPSDVRASEIEVAAPGGAMPAVLAEPTGPGPHSAVVVIMEAFGLLPNIGNIAARIASLGYVALAPDFYYRQLPEKTRFGYDELDGAIGAMSRLDDGEFLADQRAVLAYLKARPDATGKVGVTGFCMGGRLSFLSARDLPGEVACAAPFYGGGIAGLLDGAERIRCPLQLFFGEKDAFIPLDQVNQVEARLQQLGADFDLRVYPGADHGFFCEERASYHEDAAADSWQRLQALFARTLA